MKELSVQVSESRFVGLLLAFAGGILDAYTYINRGEVFATAETGNMVMMGVHLARGIWGEALYYLFPILAFSAGVLCTDAMRLRFEAPSASVHWRQPLLLMECLVIALVAFLPLGALDPLANILISFTSAVQIESFRKFEGCACATTMCTGNLRSGTEAMFQWFRTGEVKRLHTAKLYFGLIFAFILGAISNAFLTTVLSGHSVLLACLPLLWAFALMFQETKSNEKGR